MRTTPSGETRAGPRRRRAGVAALVVLAGLLQLVTAACTNATVSANCAGPAYTLRVLASSDLDDMTPVLAQAARATGVTVSPAYVGSITGAQEVVDGTAERDGYQAVWFDSDADLNLYPAGIAALNGTTDVMSSPVVLGLRASDASRLGWTHGTVTWGEIARAAAAGQFTFGMSDPATSNAGLSALVSAATALAGQGTALTAAQIPGVASQLSAMFHAQTLTVPSSAALQSAYLRDLENPTPVTPDGVFGYESQLLELQARAPRNDPLTLVYPADGVLEASYPLSILTGAPPAAKTAWQRLTCYLTSTPGQQAIMADTHRRPVSQRVPLAPELAAHRPFSLPFPAAAGTVTRLIGLYQGTLRTPGRTVYVLDTSASMRGARLSSLMRALDALTGAGSTLSGEFSMFRAGEEVTFLPFSYGPGAPATFSIPARDPGPVLARIRGYISGLRAHGRTAIYDSLVTAYQLLQAQNVSSPGRIDSIVLITDGENDWGRGLGQFLAYYRTLSATSAAAPVYPIAVGEADLNQLQQVASATGGTLFDAEREPLSMLSIILADLRGYQ